MRGPFDELLGDGEPAKPARLTFAEGKGNLQLSALFAAMIGPYRVAHGVHRSVRMSADAPKRISTNSPASPHCLYVEAFLPITQDNTLSLIVGGEDTPGDSAGVPVALVPRVGGAGRSFAAVLLPGESLFAIATLDCSFTVAEVSF